MFLSLYFEIFFWNSTEESALKCKMEKEMKKLLVLIAYLFRPIHWTVLKQVSWMHVKVGQHFYVQWTSLPTDELVNFHWGRIGELYLNLKQMC